MTLKTVVLLAGSLLLLLGLTTWAASRPRELQPSALALQADLVNKDSTVRNKQGRVLFYDFRAVEPHALFRGSGFPQHAGAKAEGDHRTGLADDSAFNFLRSLNVRHILALQDSDRSFYAEEGYFRYWSERTGYRMTVTWVPVGNADVYGKNDRSGLHAAAELIAFMRYPPSDGAVLIHDDGMGRDATGVAVAGYELWRNWGWTERDTLWGQVTDRYLATNKLLRADAAASAAAGQADRCDGDSHRAFVCRAWIDGLRDDLETLAQL